MIMNSSDRRIEAPRTGIDIPPPHKRVSSVDGQFVCSTESGIQVSQGGEGGGEGHGAYTRELVTLAASASHQPADVARGVRLGGVSMILMVRVTGTARCSTPSRAL